MPDEPTPQPDAKPAKKYGTANLIYDVDAPDSLITRRQFDQRQDKLAKFQRRAAHPNVRREYYNAERVTIIDELLSLNADGDMIRCLLACIELANRPCFGADSIPYDKKRHRFKRALAILSGDEVADRMAADPAPAADTGMVNAYLARLSQMSEPLSKREPYPAEWDSTNQCYFMRCSRGVAYLGINEDDEIGFKPKTPEPGDMVILPASTGAYAIGYYVSGDSCTVTLAMKEGLR